MTAKKYASKIEFNKVTKNLEVEIVYERVYSKEEEERMRDFYQWRFSKKVRREIPREEIRVEPKAGDVIEERTVFGVWLDRKLYCGLEEIKRVAHYVFPLLISDLKEFKEKNPSHERLSSYGINKLEELIEK